MKFRLRHGIQPLNVEMWQEGVRGCRTSPGPMSTAAPTISSRCARTCRASANGGCARRFSPASPSPSWKPGSPARQWRCLSAAHPHRLHRPQPLQRRCRGRLRRRGSGQRLWLERRRQLSARRARRRTVSRIIGSSSTPSATPARPEPHRAGAGQGRRAVRHGRRAGVAIARASVLERDDPALDDDMPRAMHMRHARLAERRPLPPPLRAAFPRARSRHRAARPRQDREPDARRRGEVIQSAGAVALHAGRPPPGGSQVDARHLEGPAFTSRAYAWPDDAAKCVDEIGAQGVVVSNHGGRQLDRTLSSVRAAGDRRQDRRSRRRLSRRRRAPRDRRDHRLAPGREGRSSADLISTASAPGQKGVSAILEIFQRDRAGDGADGCPRSLRAQSLLACAAQWRVSTISFVIPLPWSTKKHPVKRRRSCPLVVPWSKASFSRFISSISLACGWSMNGRRVVPTPCSPTIEPPTIRTDLEHDFVDLAIWPHGRSDRSRP